MDATLLATFFVRGALCGLDAVRIQEVIRPAALTPVRRAPPEVAGIVNLRGRIVTILDLGLKLGFPPAVAGPASRILVIEDRGEFIGLLVDRVEEVAEVEPEHWQAPPANVPREQARFFRAVCRVGDRVATVLEEREILAVAQSHPS
jgi:purine-binding chemotaxis protein CheW